MLSDIGSKKMERVDLVNVATAVKFLQKERVKQGMSLEEFERKSGVSWRSFYYWKNGSRDPRISNLLAMAQTLGFQIILSRENEKD